MPAVADQAATAFYRFSREDDRRDLAALLDEHTYLDEEAAVLDALFADFDQQPEEDETE